MPTLEIMDDDDPEKRTPRGVWDTLVARISDYTRTASYRNETGTNSVVSVGEAVLWGQLAWVVLADRVTDRGFQFNLSWHPRDIDDTDFREGLVVMQSGKILNPEDPNEVSAEAAYVLSATNFDIPADMRDLVALQHGYTAIPELPA